MSEKLDIFDANGNHIGVEERDVVHAKGLWHRIFVCWIINPKNQSVIMQLRGAEKKASPNKLDFPAAGHIAAGETPLEAMREIEEELGLTVKEDELIYLGNMIYAKDGKDKDGNDMINREFFFHYFLKDETPLDEYIMQPEEVDGVFEIKVEDGLKLFSKEIDEIEIKGMSRIENKNISKIITYKDFADHGMEYYLKIFIMAERLIEDKKYLAI